MLEGRCCIAGKGASVKAVLALVAAAGLAGCVAYNPYAYQQVPYAYPSGYAADTTDLASTAYTSYPAYRYTYPYAYPYAYSYPYYYNYYPYYYPYYPWSFGLGLGFGWWGGGGHHHGHSHRHGGGGHGGRGGHGGGRRG
jgi:hypothetical protein